MELLDRVRDAYYKAVYDADRERALEVIGEARAGGRVRVRNPGGALPDPGAGDPGHAEGGMPFRSL